MTTYLYRVEHGTAVLNRGDDAPLKKIGTYRTDADAKAACLAHYAKACAVARAAGRVEPSILFL